MTKMFMVLAMMLAFTAPSFAEDAPTTDQTSTTTAGEPAAKVDALKDKMKGLKAHREQMKERAQKIHEERTEKREATKEKMEQIHKERMERREAMKEKAKKIHEERANRRDELKEKAQKIHEDRVERREDIKAKAAEEHQDRMEKRQEIKDKLKSRIPTEPTPGTPATTTDKAN